MKKNIFYFYLAVGFLMRIVFSVFSFHSGDLISWKFFGNAVYEWRISPLIWQSQGPLNSLPIILFQFLNHFGINNYYFISAIYHLPFIIGDLFLIIVVYFISKDFFCDRKFEITLSIWYSSMLIFISSVWGQSEQWMVALTILSFYLIAKNKNFYAGGILGLAAAFKYVPIIISPVALFLKTTFKDKFLFLISIAAAFLGSFFVVMAANIFLFNDFGYLRYFLDRSGTIVGNFVPTVSAAFVSTGSCVWGELYNLGFAGANDLNIFKNNWLIFYAISYLIILISVFFIIRKAPTIIGTEKNKFILLCCSYSLFTVFFLFLYPQSQIQRFLNLILPLYFIFYYLKIDTKLISIINILLIMSNSIYKKGELFHFESNNLFLVITIFLSLFIIQIIFQNRKNNIVVFLLSLLIFLSLYFLGDSKLHFVTGLTNYLLLFLVLIFSLIKFVYHHERT